MYMPKFTSLGTRNTINVKDLTQNYKLLQDDTLEGNLNLILEE